MAALGAAIERRHTDRRRFSDQPVCEDLLTILVAHAAACGAELHLVAGVDARQRLIEIITASASLQRQQMGYAAELAQWTGRYAHAGDGIESRTVPSGIGRPGDVPMRVFPHGGLAQSPHSFEDEDSSVLMVLSTRHDDRLAALRAGEAASAVLLVATSLGLATTPLGQPIEVAQTRASISPHIVGPHPFPNSCCAWAGHNQVATTYRPPHVASSSTFSCLR